MATCEEPFFVLCAASSGSTLLSTILDRHRHLAIGPEIYVFNKDLLYSRPFGKTKQRMRRYLRRGLASYGEVWVRAFFFNRDAYFLDEAAILAAAEASATLREFIDRIFDSYLEHRGKRIWGEKTGSNGYFAQHLLRLYPGAKLVHLVRDPIDTIPSIQRRGGPPFHAISHYFFNHTAALRFRGLPNYLRVTYEALVRDPRPEVTRVCNHIGVDFDPAMLSPNDGDYWRKTVDSTANQHVSWTSRPEDGIRSDSVGKGREHFHAEHSRIAANIALSRHGKRLLELPLEDDVTLNQLLPELGYTPINSAPSGIECEIWRNHLPRMLQQIKSGRVPEPPLFRSIVDRSVKGTTPRAADSEKPG